jgi:hypothetical protein
MKQTLERKKQKLIKTIDKLDAMKSHKKLVIGCIESSNYGGLAWFFWGAFMTWEGKKRASASDIYWALPPNMRKFIEHA